MLKVSVRINGNEFTVKDVPWEDVKAHFASWMAMQLHMAEDADELRDLTARLNASNAKAAQAVSAAGGPSAV